MTEWAAPILAVAGCGGWLSAWQSTGGRLHVLGEQHGGTTVVAEIPLNQSREAGAASRELGVPGQGPGL
jgi:hypothetical protein